MSLNAPKRNPIKSRAKTPFSNRVIPLLIIWKYLSMVGSPILHTRTDLKEDFYACQD